jgi:hypothetical protein
MKRESSAVKVKDASIGDGRDRETFVRQVEDHSLPARQVLTDQRDARLVNSPAQIFVP